MLKVLEFINNCPSIDVAFRRLSSEPYFIDIKFMDGKEEKEYPSYEDIPDKSHYFAMLNYNTLHTENKENEIVRECRGLVLEISSSYVPVIRVVRRGFKRFFNFNEPNLSHPDNINFSNNIVTEKMDGTLLLMSFYNNKWHIGTRRNFSLPKSVLDEKETSSLYHVFSTVLRDTYYMDDISMFYHAIDSALDKSPVFKNKKHNVTLCFELCSKYNQIVVDYSSLNAGKLYLLSIFENSSSDDSEYSMSEVMDFVSLLNQHMSISIPNVYTVQSLDDCLKTIKSLPSNHEGIVVRDISNNNRMKFKTEDYLSLHKSIDKITFKKALSLVKSGNADDILSRYQSGYYRDLIEEASVKMDLLMTKISNICLETDNLKLNDISRKDFASFVTEKCISEKSFIKIYFSAYDGFKPNDILNSLSIKEIIGLVVNL